LSNPLFRTSPFFNELPETLAFIQIDLATSQLINIVRVIDILFQQSEGFQKRGLRWQIGLGCPLFERLPFSRRPSGLQTLKLNRDLEFGLQFGEGDSDIFIAISGEWEETIQAVHELRSLMVAMKFSLRFVHIGHRAGTSRDHNGFFDGTSNLQDLPPFQFSKCVFVQPEDEADDCFVGGTYLVFRKYEEDLEMWNDLPVFIQEKLIGRNKDAGYFLDGSKEWSPEAWKVTIPEGHIRRANPREIPVDHPDHWKERIYRRSIKFIERKGNGSLLYGLLFIALMRNPELQFVRIYNERLLPEVGSQDFFLSSGYLRPMQSACYFLPTDLSQAIKPFNTS
jgi:Dyp-type peroxidase family